MTAARRFPVGNRDGHADPFGARAARQARAGRVREAGQIHQAADARHKVRVGDYVLANDKIAAYIEAEGESDGYDPFGGEILAIEAVGDDGRPKGVSLYGESMIMLSRQALKPESVTVLADGSDGKAAIVRASGLLANIPFLETFKALFSEEFGFPAALDYVLEPGAEKLLVRLSLVNTQGEARDFANAQAVGFFQESRGPMFAPGGAAFDDPKGAVPFVVYDQGEGGFAWRMVGTTMGFGLNTGGFQYYASKGLALDACSEKTVDYAEVIPGGPGLDGVLAAVRRASGDASFREVRGTVLEQGGEPVPFAVVHVLAQGGTYLSRVTADARGAFVVHAPPEAATLVATAKGWAPSAETPAPPGQGDVTVRMATSGVVHVTAVDSAGKAPLPVRVQVIPKTPVPSVPSRFGVSSEAVGRLHQDFAVTGESTLRVPPGEHRVIVSRGYEWELADRTVTVEAGKTQEVSVELAHSVDSTGVMCADFHIHSMYSADSTDPVVAKVKGAIADGLDIPVSSEHEIVHDFTPVIHSLGLDAWAFSFPSEEFTTFTWGHFGILPILPHPDRANNGAISWVGKKAPEIFEAIHALPEKPVLMVNHPASVGFKGYFSQTLFDRDKGAGSGEQWSDRFDVVEVFNDSDFDDSRSDSVADWFSLLNHGRMLAAAGNSDSHGLRTAPAGWPRNCIRFGHDDPTRLTAEAVRDALARGESVVSGGLFMSVEGPGGALPGGSAPGGGSFQIVVQAPGWLDTTGTTVEVIVDGVTKQTAAMVDSGASPAKRLTATVSVPPGKWVVFHAKAAGRDLSPLHPGRRAFAVSNPIRL